MNIIRILSEISSDICLANHSGGIIKKTSYYE